MSAARAVLVWVAFVGVHAVLITENLVAPNGPLGDVLVTYPSWWQSAIEGNGFPGLTTVGVYPFLALGPIAIAALGVGAWFALVIAVDAVALAVLVRRSVPAGYAWLAFQLALGPIAIGRIDAITVALGIIAVALIDRSPRTTGVVIAVATWVKVWPIALGIAAIRSARFATVARWSVGIAVVVTLIGIAGGDPASVFGFIGQQQGRGLQVESVTATPWLWDVWSGGTSTLAFSPDIYTFEISGPGTDLFSGALTVVQVFALLSVVALLLSHRRPLGDERNASFGYALLVIIAILIVANKVGSPQFVSWLAVPLVALVLARGPRTLTSLATLVGVIAILTRLVYPYTYFAFLELRTIPLVLVTLRNIAELVLLVWAWAILVAQLRVEKLAQQFADLGIGDKKGVVPVR